MRSLRLILLWSLVTLSLASRLLPQDVSESSGSVKVTFVDYVGNRVSSAKVELKQKHGKYHAVAYSDSSGTALFENVPPGEYDVWGRMKKFKVAHIKDLEVVSEKTTSLRIGMVPDPPPKDIVYD